MIFDTEFVEDKILQIENWVDILTEAIDYDGPYFITALLFIMFNPIFWNIVARLEYYTHFLTKLTGSAKRGCYLLAATIFCLGIARDLTFEKALRFQEISPLLDTPTIKNIGYVLLGVGQVLVLSSMYQLGITGTYLGDYFGILMKDRVTAFPFNVSNNPMYQGSTMSFVGTTLISGKPAGLVLAFFVHFMYYFALKFEEPFTTEIYSRRDQERAAKKN
ncbi:Phosphatidyl-N-methylethanolamine N-methyltransferase [Nakaseomyces bracarensis]|uniref:Phosphatidyl-N-methylethanolamine N-methyltransferase n=1 Tax=Nakaseomyces bracarensis TaxID=273131 RepID=A0ABR4NQ94_9SACH